MKKAVTISIAQTLFTIEEDAYQKLDHYLKSIRQHFTHTQGQAEIIEDIEARISEQFLETKKRVITLKEVETVIESIGRVEDFDTPDEKGEEGSTPPAGKKLYRNPHDKIIAGVCSGLAAYLNIKPLWVRVVFVLLTIVTFGAWILVYILMAMMIPEAKTTFQTLEMKGAPVNLETMSQSIKEKVGTIRGKHGSKIKTILNWPLQKLKKSVDFLGRFLGPVLRVVSGLLLTVFTLGGIIFSTILTYILLLNGEDFFDIPFSKITSGAEFLVAGISIYLLLLIPLIFIFMIGISLLRKKSLVHFKLGMTFLFFWCASLISGSIAGFNAAADFEKYLRTHELFEKVTKELEIPSDIKHISVSGNIHLNLVQGPETSLVVSGRSKQIVQLDQLDRIPSNKEVLSLHAYYGPFCFLCGHDPIEITLTTPHLETIEGYDQAFIEHKNWQSETPVEIAFYDMSNGNLAIEAPNVNVMSMNNAMITLNLDSPEVTFFADNGSFIEATGAIARTEAIASNSSTIDLTKTQIKAVKAEAHGYSTIYLQSLEVLEALASDWSNVFYQDAKKQVSVESSNDSFIGSEGDYEKIQMEQTNQNNMDDPFESVHNQTQEAFLEATGFDVAEAMEFQGKNEQVADETMNPVPQNMPSVIEAEGTFSLPF